jgi:hypothetical protein
VQYVRKTAAMRFSSSVSTEERDLVVGFLQREELHLLRVVLSTQRRVF